MLCRKLDLPPSQSVFGGTNDDIPKSMSRILNAEKIQNSWREKKRKLEENDDPSAVKRRKAMDDGEGSTSRKALSIKPGESLKHFSRYAITILSL